MVIGAGLEVMGIGMIPVFIAIVANPDRVLAVDWIAPILDYAAIDDGGDLLVFGGIILVITFLFKNIYIIVFNYIRAKFLFNRMAFISSRLFDGYMNASYSFMLSRNSAEILRNATQEGAIVVIHIMSPMLKLMMDILLIAMVIPLLFVVNPIITSAAIVLFAVAGGGFLKLIRGKIQIFGERAQIEREVMIQAVNEGVGGLKDIRVLQRGGWFSERFKRSVRRYANAQIFHEITKRATKPVLETVAVTSMLSVSLVLFWQGKQIDLIIATLALFGAAAIRLMPTMREVVDAINSLRYYSYSIHLIHREFQRLESVSIGKVIHQAGEERIRKFCHEISFEGISFSYPDSRFAAVNNLSLTIPEGKAVGFIGPSGSGKTTVVDLLLGLLDPQEGKIKIDGIDLRDDVEGWLQNVGYIPQFIFLADDTLARNIAFGLPDKKIDEDRLWAAVESAQLSEMVMHLPEGIHTRIGERGVRLSGGQRQRIGIARALYENPSVLIMDEATSALDHETEKCIIESIERLKGERTIIMIAHRLSTVRNCDCLFMMEKGRVKDSGAFVELSDRNAELCPEIAR